MAGLIAFRFAPRAWYMYGASTEKHRNLMPNHLLQWEAIRRVKSEGCTVYDMWGAPDVPSEDDPLWGVCRFKEGFGGEFVRHIGAYDYPVSRPSMGSTPCSCPAILISCGPDTGGGGETRMSRRDEGHELEWKLEVGS